MNKSSFYISFAVAWTFVESIIALSGIQEWNTAILRSAFVLLLGGAVLKHLRDNRVVERKSYEGQALINEVIKSIEKGFNYLQNENKNNNGQRMRLSPSIMESATTIGAITLASKVLKKNNNVDKKTVDWLLGSLKKQFRDQVPVKYFECSRCDNGNVCNVAYFDYLSHFYYTKGSPLYTRFTDEFQFLSELFTSRIFCNKAKCGWKLFEDGNFDILATSTNMILCYVFNSLTESQEKRVIKLILSEQTKNGSKKGSWPRVVTDSKWCAGELEIITVHRAIECLAISMRKHPEFKSNIEEAIKSGTIYLKSCQGGEEPVNYEYQVGIDDVEILRGTGHIVQAMIKADISDSFLTDKVNLLIHAQNKNGSFVGKSDHLGGNRDITNKTDLTAFITRTLCLYHQKYA